MTDEADIDALAGEYVLGTLAAGERASVAARRRREPALDAAIISWERRLGPLAEGVAPVTPPHDVYDRIEQRLAKGPSVAAGAAADVIHLQQRLKTWRGVAIAASSLAACLVLGIGVREATRPAPTSYVGVFVQDDVLPSFLLSVDFGTRTLTVKPVSAKPLPERSYQLWILHEKLGAAPQSLGLIEIDNSGVSRREVSFDRALLTTATFGVSVEPIGGSPTGRPTGPALHAKLMPAAL